MDNLLELADFQILFRSRFATDNVLRFDLMTILDAKRTGEVGRNDGYTPDHIDDSGITDVCTITGFCCGGGGCVRRGMRASNDRWRV